MGFDREKIKQIRGLLIFTALLILGIIYSSSVVRGISFLFKILTPFVAGGCIAFVMNLPMRSIENKLLAKWKGKSAKLLKRPVSLFLSMLFIAGIIAFALITVAPRLKESFVAIGAQVSVFAQKVLDDLERLSASNPELLAELKKLENTQIDWSLVWKHLGTFLTSGMGSVLNSAYAVTSSIIGGIVDTFVAIVFAIYILAQKERLADQGRRILKAYLTPEMCEKILYILHLLSTNFGHFITGQCTEAVILGCMFFLTMTIFGFPYALVISVLIALTALIPIVGAFIGCAVGALLILMINPMKALWFIILFLILQQIEGNLIYPHVVGSSVGLPSIWVLVAVTLGGSLFGVPGMLFFIPLTSTVYALLRDSVNERNRRKKKCQTKCQTK